MAKLSTRALEAEPLVEKWPLVPVHKGRATGTKYPRLKAPPLVPVAYEPGLKVHPRGRLACARAKDL